MNKSEFVSGSSQAVQSLAEKRVAWREFQPMSHLEVITDVRAGLPDQQPSTKNDVTDRGFEDWERAVQRMRRVAHVLGCKECMFELRERRN